MQNGRLMKDGKRSPPLTLLISANSFWNILNFRTNLIEGLTAAGYRIVLAAPDVDSGWARQRGIEAHDIQVDRSGLNPWTDAQLILQYIRLFRSVRPDFYLGFTAKPNIYGSLAARFCGAASIPNVSGLGTAFIREGVLGGFLSFLYRIAFRNSPRVMFQNPDDRALFVSKAIVRDAQAVLLPGSGIDLERYRPEGRLHDGPPRFLFIGRLLGDKGVREFVSAARLLKAEHPDWKFQLLGERDGGNRTSIGEGELQSWIDEAVVDHLGQVSDVRPHIAAATAVVLPSYREGLPRSLLEAAAMARPLVATDVPGSRQLVRDGINGFSCKARDPASLAEAMRRIGSMGAAEIEEMGRNGRLMVEQEYGEERVVRAYLEALTAWPAGQPCEVQACSRVAI